MKATWLLCAILLLALASIGYAEPPNVLVLFMDDQRADTIAALGNSVIQTPNLDRLVQRGVSFDRAYMQGGMHGATCVPSRAMLLSAKPLFRIDEQLLRDPAWPAAFGKAGYRTFATGKWHNGEASIPKCFAEAKSIFVGGMTDPLKAKINNMVGSKLDSGRLSEKHACSVFVDEAITFLNRPDRQPFFCYVAFDGPHDPHIVPDSFDVHYSVDSIPLPPNFLPKHPWDNGEMEVRDEKLLPTPRPEDAVRSMLADYYRYVSFLDREIGRLLDALEASPFASNTIVVFAADSGVARGSHGLIGKQNCYEHSLRIPLIIAGPGVPYGKRTSALCYLFDLMPTLGELCSVSDPETSEGRSFASVLKAPETTFRESLVFAYRQVQRAYCDSRWKLITYPQANRVQLFDLLEDPYEINNLADHLDQADRVKLLTETMRKELELNGDRFHVVPK